MGGVGGGGLAHPLIVRAISGSKASQRKLALVVRMEQVLLTGGVPVLEPAHLGTVLAGRTFPLGFLLRVPQPRLGVRGLFGLQAVGLNARKGKPDQERDGNAFHA